MLESGVLQQSNISLLCAFPWWLHPKLLSAAALSDAHLDGSTWLGVKLSLLVTPLGKKKERRKKRSNFLNTDIADYKQASSAMTQTKYVGWPWFIRAHPCAEHRFCGFLAGLSISMLPTCPGYGSASAAKDRYEALWGENYFEVHLRLRIEKETSSLLLINNNSVLTKIKNNTL